MNWKTSLWLIATVVTSASSQVVFAENPLLQLHEGPNSLLYDVIGNEVVAEDVDTSTPLSTTEEFITDTITETNEDTAGTTEQTTENPDNEATATNDPIIETENGRVRGFQWPGPREILAYFDIPYGKFNTSFGAPTEPEAWQDILEVQEHNSRCPQLDGDTCVGDMDCLTLSIFTPVNPVRSSVMFYIHESNFVSGSGNPSIYGPEYIVPRNIILVLPNYRLGPLGFLCLGDGTAPGNAALKDLALALQWTKNNIEAFGGNPTNIAVSGDGTSAALVGYLALSLTTRNLMSKVITDSGSVLSHWAIDRNPEVTAEKLANLIRNNSEGEQLGENVFENVTTEVLLTSAKDLKIRPCIEKEGFLTETPWNILQNDELNLTFIVGSASHAGLIEALQHNEESIEQMKENFSSVLPDDLVFGNADDRNYVAEQIMSQYFSDNNITLGNVKGLSLYYTDALYLGPSIRFARALVDAGAKVYVYEFSFVGALNKELASIQGAPALGAVRGDIVGYLFAQDGRIPVDGTAERRVVDMMGDLWTSFLDTSEPTASDFVWQHLNASNPTDDWLAIGAEARPEIGFHTARLTLWADVYREHFIERDTNQAFALISRYTLIGAALLYLKTSF